MPAIRPDDQHDNGPDREDPEIGRLGEELAARLAARRGGIILATNWRSLYGEIDLVWRDRDVIAFTEVKTRRSTRHGGGFEAVDRTRRSRLRNAALYWLAELDDPLDPVCRFDVVEILWDEEGNHKVDWMKDAFE